MARGVQTPKIFPFHPPRTLHSLLHVCKCLSTLAAQRVGAPCRVRLFADLRRGGSGEARRFHFLIRCRRESLRRFVLPSSLGTR